MLGIRRFVILGVVTTLLSLFVASALCCQPLETGVQYNDLGVDLAEQGRYEEALAHFTKAIELDPNYAMAYNNRGVAMKSATE